MDFCCTCTAPLAPGAPQSLGRQTSPHRIVPCCQRTICVECMQSNERFAHYCPYCQVSDAPSSLPQRLRDPPAYTSVPSTLAATADSSAAPPPYTPSADDKAAPVTESEKDLAIGSLHFLSPDDTIISLSLQYGVAASVLRRANNITSDHLLLGRRTVLLPGLRHSQSPRPVEGEEEELRKGKIRRMMVSCKIVEYDVALMYLEQSGYNLEAAIESFVDDDVWAKNNPAQRLAIDSVVVNTPRRRSRFWRDR